MCLNQSLNQFDLLRSKVVISGIHEIIINVMGYKKGKYLSIHTNKYHLSLPLQFTPLYGTFID